MEDIHTKRTERETDGRTGGGQTDRQRMQNKGVLQSSNVRVSIFHLVVLTWSDNHACAHVFPVVECEPNLTVLLLRWVVDGVEEPRVTALANVRTRSYHITQHAV